VAKVDATGTAFIYCGYIGGYDNDEGLGVAVDAAGSARVTGGTQSDERAFPIVGGPDLTHNGYWDAFVARVSWSRLVGSGSPGLGGRVVLSLSTGADAGLPYQVASAFGRDTIPIGKRRIELSPDLLLFVSISGTMPSVFQDYAGVLDAQGRADAAIHIPSLPVLIGVRLYSAFVTLSPSAPSGIRSISNTFMFSITK
jgi:hypothetical protein